MKNTLLRRATVAVVGLSCAATALAQFPQLITDFEISGQGNNYVVQPGSLDDLSVVMFQDPAEADVTTLNVLGDAFATQSNGDPPLPSTEESFLASFGGFSGANGSLQFMDVRFEWANTDPNRWALVETLQSPTLGDPSVHLGGKVRFYVNIPDCAQFEYPGLFTVTPEIGVALLISETGQRVPLGFQDDEVLNGSFEFVGVSSVAGADTANPVPVPTRFVPITDAFCAGGSTGPNGNWRLVEFDLPNEGVVGWSFRGGDGVLDATGLGDGENRGVLAGIVLTVRDTDTTSNFVEFLVDQVEFEAPVTDPAVAPLIAGPVIAGDVNVQVNQVVTRATSVVLEIDRSDDNNMDEFVADDTFTVTPTLTPTSEERFVLFTLSPALAVGDRVRAHQAVNADIGPDSLVVAVNPPAEFSATLSLDEAGSLGTQAVFEWVGATGVSGSAGTQGKPVFVQNAVWQKIEYSLIPGVEPVISFAGGNGQLEPDGGLYNIDSMFFTIDSTDPSTGPYDMFIDHVYYITADDEEVLISDAESVNPFPFFRGQSTSINQSSIISGLTSFDGVNSNRQQWEFENTAAANTHAPYRPTVTFPDSAKAVGMWLLVEEPRLSALPLPAVEQQIIGDPPAVTVNNIDPAATLVELLVNGLPAGSVDPQGAGTVDIVPDMSLNLRDSISARYTTASETSDNAYPRVSQPPAPPAVDGPLVEGQTAVAVTGIFDAGNAVASQVSLYDGETLLMTMDPEGGDSVTFAVNPPLVAGQQINARQTVNGIQSVASAPVGVGTGVTVCVVINEFSYDDSGGDDREFVELYNAEPDPVDISGWTLRGSGTEPLTSKPNADYIIPGGTVLAPGDYYVAGDPSVANVDLALPGGDLWENGNDAIELLDENGVVVDTLIYELNKGPVTVSPAEGGVWGNFTSIDGSAQSLSRWFDGYDTNDNGRDFGLLPITPGATNLIPPVSPLTENFTGAAGNPVANWIGSFVNLTIIDPGVPDAFNTNAIPASPQGGNAAVCWDPAGGGNQCGIIDEPRYNYGFSAQVYFDVSGAQFTAGNGLVENENWSIGLGTVMTFHNSFGANGNTGLMWEFLIEEDLGDGGTVGQVALRLLDRNNGGADGVVLLEIPDVDVTTGWHTLSIERNYENYSGAFDGTSTSGTLPAIGPSHLQMGYREFVSGTPGTLRPITIDALTITAPTPPVLGACCTDCGCELLTEAICNATGGSYGGDGTDCTDGDNNGVADICEALTAPTPTLAPICDGDVLVELGNIAAEASTITIYADGVNPIAMATPTSAGVVRVYVDPPLMAGEAITATQTIGLFESEQSNEEVVAVCPRTYCVPLFEDDFDIDSSGNWTVSASPDTAHQFAYDYSADAIPPAPGGATTLGLKMEANLTQGAAGFVVASPTGLSPTGDYALEVDFWINFATAGSGTTEFIGAGVGHDGLTAGLDGAAFIGTGEGGSARDYRLYKDGVEQLLTDPVVGQQYSITTQDAVDPDVLAAFPAQPAPDGQGQTGSSQDGELAFAWHTMTIEVDSEYQTVTYYIDGLEFGTLVCGGELGATCDVDGALQLIYADIFSSVASLPEFQFGVFDNFRVLLPQSLYDWDCDGDFDADDTDGLGTCLEGPDVSPADPACITAFDADGDGDVDMADAAALQLAF